MRTLAQDLNERNGRAGSQEFDTYFPHRAQLASIAALDAVYDLDRVGAKRALDPVQRLLFELTGWLSGVRLAGETLRTTE